MSKIFLSFLRLGAGAFGGPAMVTHIKELSVDRCKWLDEKSFTDGMVLCQSIPGPTAIQMAAYVGLAVRGIKGAVVSYLGFGLPAFLFILFPSSLYTRFLGLPGIVSLFSGLQVTVVAIIANATYSFSRSALRDYRDMPLAAASALLFFTDISRFFVIFGAALFGGFAFRGIAVAEKDRMFHVKHPVLFLTAPVFHRLKSSRYFLLATREIWKVFPDADIKITYRA